MDGQMTRTNDLSLVGEVEGAFTENRPPVYISQNVPFDCVVELNGDYPPEINDADLDEILGAAQSSSHRASGHTARTAPAAVTGQTFASQATSSLARIREFGESMAALNSADSVVEWLLDAEAPLCLFQRDPESNIDTAAETPTDSEMTLVNSLSTTAVER